MKSLGKRSAFRFTAWMVVIARLVAHLRQSLCDVRLLDLAPQRRAAGRPSRITESGDGAEAAVEVARRHSGTENEARWWAVTKKVV
jgi:hypothetical protein